MAIDHSDHLSHKEPLVKPFAVCLATLMLMFSNVGCSDEHTVDEQERQQSQEAMEADIEKMQEELPANL